MKKIFFLIAVFLFLLFGSHVSLVEEEGRSVELVCQSRISEKDSTTDKERAIESVSFEFLVSFVLFFVAYFQIIIKNVSFKRRHIKVEHKYRKQRPRSELAFI